MPPASSTPPAPPPAPMPQQPGQQPGQDYGFIMQPPKPPRRSLSLPSLPGGNSPIIKIGAVLVGLLVLFILFSIVKGLLSGGGNTQALTAVAQDQQAMIHILTNGAGQDNQQQATLSAQNQSFAATAQLSLTSAQQQLLDYMKANGKKVSTKTLALKISSTTDQQLTTAASNSTYDTTFQSVMQTQLKSYETALNEAYKQTTGPKGRKLLVQEYQGAQLLLKQLNAPSS